MDTADTASTLTGSSATDILAFLGVSIGVVLLVGLIAYILQVIAYWKIFKKFGEPGWKSIIPFYNMYIQYKYTWGTGMFWATIIIGVVAGCCMGAAGDDSGSAPALVGAVLELVMCVLVIIAEYKLYKAFGHGIGWFILGIFFPTIMNLVLGFGSSQYVGNGKDIA